LTGPGLTEPHPFTISTGKPGDELRITFRVLGDGTRRLARKGLKVGESLRVQGPFGRFFPARDNAPQIWIAGGIGITPFMAWAEAMAEDGPPVHLFYAVRSRDEAPYLNALTERADQIARLQVHPVVSNETGRLTADRIAEVTGLELSGANPRVFLRTGPRCAAACATVWNATVSPPTGSIMKSSRSAPVSACAAWRAGFGTAAPNKTLTASG
jgi:predicted ferric reductase